MVSGPAKRTDTDLLKSMSWLGSIWWGFLDPKRRSKQYGNAHGRFSLVADPAG
jgi:hypothetical protein